MDFYIENGIYGIVVVGIIGEFVILDFEEYCQVIGYIIKCVVGCILVIVGIGGNSIWEVIELIIEVYKLGVDVCLLVVLYYNKLI